MAPLNVSMPVSMRERLDKFADRYGVAVGANRTGGYRGRLTCRNGTVAPRLTRPCTGDRDVNARTMTRLRRRADPRSVQAGRRLAGILLGCVAGALLLGGCVSQAPPGGGVLVEGTTVKYGVCTVGTTVDPITDEVAEHLLWCGSNDFAARVGVVATCYGAQGNQMAALLRPALAVQLPDGYGPVLRYRADKDEPQDDTGSWSVSNGSVVTFEAEAVERLLVSLAGATDAFTFQIAGIWPRSATRYSHTVELIEPDDAAFAVEDLRLRCGTAYDPVGDE